MRVPRLTTPRLILRPYQADDLATFAALNGDPEVRRHVGGPLTHADAARRFQNFLTTDTPGPEVWAITLSGTGAYIGHCWLGIQPGASDSELGFLITPNQWRKGYGTEVGTALLDYATIYRGYSRVIATVDADHPASIKVLERVGMKRECERRD